MTRRSVKVSDVESSAPGVPCTIFAMPKPFHGHIGTIQRNAIGSWLRLTPRPEVILFGDEGGVAEFAATEGLVHEPHVRRNEYGTPLMNDMFRCAARRASHDVLSYANADIVLFDDFAHAASRVVAAGFPEFLLIGRRIDVNVDDPINFTNDGWREQLQQTVARDGSPAPRVCKDYFVFRKLLFAEIPPFAVGRAVYDNWFVYDAKRRGVPVIDASAAVRAVHQNHDYGHVAGGSRGQAYVGGVETKRNRDLAGGMRVVSGSTATWTMTPNAIRRRRVPSDLLQFAADLPRFLRLVLELYGWIDGSYRRARREENPTVLPS